MAFLFLHASPHVQQLDPHPEARCSTPTMTTSAAFPGLPIRLYDGKAVSLR